MLSKRTNPFANRPLPHPLGKCQCGCGNDAPISTETRSVRGWVKGQPRFYLSGHGNRTSTSDYKIEDRGYKTPCWIWQRGKMSPVDHYGAVRIGTRKRPAHRVIYEKHKGQIPRGKQLDHLCRVHECVNPDHLEPVTPAENTRRGQLAKLTPAKVREIKSLLSTVGPRELARRYNVTHSTIGWIKAGKTWRNV